jgi:hypothetical protein
MEMSDETAEESRVEPLPGQDLEETDAEETAWMDSFPQPSIEFADVPFLTKSAGDLSEGDLELPEAGETPSAGDVHSPAGSDAPAAPPAVTFTRADDYLFPWEIPDPAPSGAESPDSRESDAASADEGSDSVDVGRTSSSTDSAAELSQPPVLPRGEVSPPPSRETSSTKTSPGSTRDEDHDLESFQAWLRSLKR